MGVGKTRLIRFSRVVSLSHTLQPGVPCWPGDPPMSIEPVAELHQDGYYLNRLTLGEHTGTHVNAPNHFFAGGRGVDQLPADLLVLPAVVIDCRQAAAANPDFVLTPSDIGRFEERFGLVPPGSAVLLLTGWHARWPDEQTYLNAGPDGRFHFPGFGEDAVRFLLEERGASAFGIDTHGLDPGADDTYSANKRALAHGALVLENLTNLDLLPPIGSTVVIGVLRVAGGSGAPAAVLALAP